MKIKDGKKVKKWAKEKAVPAIKKGVGKAKVVAKKTAKGVEGSVKWYQRQKRRVRRSETYKQLKRTGRATGEYFEERGKAVKPRVETQPLSGQMVNPNFVMPKPTAPKQKLSFNVWKASTDNVMPSILKSGKRTSPVTGMPSDWGYPSKKKKRR